MPVPVVTYDCIKNNKRYDCFIANCSFKEKGNHLDVEVSLHISIRILVMYNFVMPQICLLQVSLWLLGLHIHPSSV